MHLLRRWRMVGNELSNWMVRFLCLGIAEGASGSEMPALDDRTSIFDTLFQATLN